MLAKNFPAFARATNDMALSLTLHRPLTLGFCAQCPGVKWTLLHMAFEAATAGKEVMYTTDEKDAKLIDWPVAGPTVVLDRLVRVNPHSKKVPMRIGEFSELPWDIRIANYRQAKVYYKSVIALGMELKEPL